jgi:DUF4097 and DUF4098 domain-containing protein YvlB
MIAAPVLLCALLAQATPPVPPPPPAREHRLHVFHGPPPPFVVVPDIDLSELEDLDLSQLGLEGLDEGLSRMREELRRARDRFHEEVGKDGSLVARMGPQDDDEDDDDQDDDQQQQERDRRREQREEQQERAHERAEKARERAQEQAERAREQAQQARERAQEQAQQARDHAQEQADRAREQADRMREQMDRQWDQADRHRFRFGWQPFGEDDEDDDSDSDRPSVRSNGRNGVATLPAKGPVTLRVRAQSGEVEVVATDKAQVSARLTDVPSREEVQLAQSGDRIEVRVGTRRALRRGKLHVEVPKGSSVDFESTSADVTVQGVGGDARVRTMSGDVKLTGVRKADVETISGDVTFDASGPVRVHTVSGNAIASTADPGVQLEFESASGNLDWTGACARGCRLSTETVSGQIALAVDTRSSFELSYSSHSGDFRDDLNLQVKRSPTRKHGGVGGWLEAVYGKGEGVIECDAFSGDLQIRKK